MEFQSFDLKGNFVYLVPYEDIYAFNLAKTANADMMYYAFGPAEWTPEGIRTYISQRFAGSLNRIPLVIIEQGTNAVIGFAAFINIMKENRRLEIGPVWIAKAYQGSSAFTESMYMMLRHAFDVEGTRRVEFTCDSENMRSKMGLLKIGAMMEGILRKDVLRSDNSVRDTIVFGVIDTDWPEVSQRLQARLYPEKHSHVSEMLAIDIRPSCLDDLAAILVVEKSAFGQGYSFGSIRQYYDLFGDLLFVAETEEKDIVGYVLAGIKAEDRGLAWILSLGVRRDYQKRGVGGRLMDAIHTELFSRGCREELLTVHPDKAHVIHFYEKIGYSKQQLCLDYFGPGAPRYVMQRVVEEK